MGREHPRQRRGKAGQRQPGPGLLRQGDAQGQVRFHNAPVGKTRGQPARPVGQRPFPGQGHGEGPPAAVGARRVQGPAQGAACGLLGGKVQSQGPVAQIGKYGEPGKGPGAVPAVGAHKALHHAAAFGQPSGDGGFRALARHRRVQDQPLHGQPLHRKGRQGRQPRRPDHGRRLLVRRQLGSPQHPHDVGRKLADLHPARKKRHKRPVQAGIANHKPRPGRVHQGHGSHPDGKRHNPLQSVDPGRQTGCGGHGPLQQAAQGGAAGSGLDARKQKRDDEHHARQGEKRQPHDAAHPPGRSGRGLVRARGLRHERVSLSRCGIRQLAGLLLLSQHTEITIIPYVNSAGFREGDGVLGPCGRSGSTVQAIRRPARC
ncbi:liga [hydrocarbon metagenome]|uniref:Liga n=1 Tax=hydrocarbon metagenome TaxID=938273 RepID=A0A0W8G8X5_9ZZZZ